MATLASLTQDVEDLLYGIAQVERPEEDPLGTNITAANDVEIQFATVAMWKKGDIAQPVLVASGSELIIFDEDHVAGPADTTVRRGYQGTTAASSYTAPEGFYRNPTYQRFLIERFIAETVDHDLYPHVWMWEHDTITYSVGVTTYALEADQEDVISIYQPNLGSSSGRYDPLDNGMWRVIEVNSAIGGWAANTKALRLFHVFDPDATVYYTAKQRPDSADYTTLSDGVAQLVPYKVVAKMLGSRVPPMRKAPGRTPSRSNSGDRPLRDSTFFDAEFIRMRREESNRLKKQIQDWQPRYRRRTPIRG